MPGLWGSLTQKGSDSRANGLQHVRCRCAYWLLTAPEQASTKWRWAHEGAYTIPRSDARNRGRETQEAGDALDLKVEAVLDGMRA